MKTCQCGIEFQPRSNNHLFCTKQCQNRHNYQMRKLGWTPPEPKPCVICHRLFRPYNSRSVTCGRKICVKARENETKRAWENRGGASKPALKPRKARQCRFPGCHTPTRNLHGYCSENHQRRHAIALEGAAILREFAGVG